MKSGYRALTCKIPISAFLALTLPLRGFVDWRVKKPLPMPASKDRLEMKDKAKQSRSTYRDIYSFSCFVLLTSDAFITVH